MIKDFKLQIIEDVVIENDIIPGLNGLQINYNSSIGNKPDINNPDNLGLLAFEDAVQKAKLGTTIVDGGYLVTGMINASRIDTGTLNADRIATKSITGAKLADGTITPVQIDYLDAGDITAGTLSLTSTGVGLKVLSGGDIEFESETYSSFSSILFKKKDVADPYWNIYFTATGGGGYNEGDLVFDPGIYNGHFVNIGSFASTTIGVYTHLNVFGNINGNNATLNSVYPSVDNYYLLGTGTKRWASVYSQKHYFGDSNYLAYNDANSISSNCNLVPSSNLIANLGSSALRWYSAYLQEINLNKIHINSSILLPSSGGDIVNYSYSGVDQFRGQPGAGTWKGSFDMSAY
jgi:hypothetical protein